MSRQRGRVALGAVLGSTWMVGLALPPYLLSRAVDSLADGQRDVVLRWAAALVEFLNELFHALFVGPDIDARARVINQAKGPGPPPVA